MSLSSLAGLQTADEVIAGDLAGLHESADRLLTQSRLHEAVGTDLVQIPSVIDWRGEAGDRFQVGLRQLPDAFAASAHAHQRAASAIREHAEVVQTARRGADEAIGLWQQAERITALAQVERAEPGRRIPSDRLDAGRALVSDLGAPLRTEALEIANVALRRVEQSAAFTAQQVRAAAEDLPDDPGFWDRLGAGWSDFWHGATDVGAAIGNGILSFGNALIENPDILAEIAAGLALIQLGIAAEVGGLALDATGVGTVSESPSGWPQQRRSRPGRAWWRTGSSGP